MTITASQAWVMLNIKLVSWLWPHNLSSTLPDIWQYLEASWHQPLKGDRAMLWHFDKLFQLTTQLAAAANNRGGLDFSLVSPQQNSYQVSTQSDVLDHSISQINNLKQGVAPAAGHEMAAVPKTEIISGGSHFNGQRLCIAVFGCSTSQETWRGVDPDFLPSVPHPAL